MLFQTFVRNKSQNEQENKRPGNNKRGAPEIKDDKSTNERTKAELKRCDKPEMLAGGFILLGTRFESIQEDDTNGYENEINRHPQIVPQGIYSRESKGVKSKTADE